MMANSVSYEPPWQPGRFLRATKYTVISSLVSASDMTYDGKHHLLVQSFAGFHEIALTLVVDAQKKNCIALTASLVTGHTSVAYRRREKCFSHASIRIQHSNHSFRCRHSRFVASVRGAT